MTSQEFQHALARLGWRQADFCRAVGVSANTPSRWVLGEVPIPAWAAAYLGLLGELHELHERYLAGPARRRPKAGTDSTQDTPTD